MPGFFADLCRGMLKIPLPIQEVIHILTCPKPAEMELYTKLSTLSTKIDRKTVCKNKTYVLFICYKVYNFIKKQEKSVDISNVKIRKILHEKI